AAPPPGGRQKGAARVCEWGLPPAPRAGGAETPPPPQGEAHVAHGVHGVHVGVVINAQMAHIEEDVVAHTAQTAQTAHTAHTAHLRTPFRRRRVFQLPVPRRRRSALSSIPTSTTPHPPPPRP